MPTPPQKIDYEALAKSHNGVSFPSLSHFQKYVDTTLAAPPTDTGWRGEVERYGQGVAQGLTYPVVHPEQFVEGLVKPVKGPEVALQANEAVLNPVRTAGQLTGAAIGGEIAAPVSRTAKSFGESLKTTEPEAGFIGQPPALDRRKDTAMRQRVAEMNPEEMRRILLTSEKTSLPNKRAFDEAEWTKPAAGLAQSDADGLKALNDKFGYAAGDELLRAKADALREAGLDAYHEKGDEFLYRGGSPEELKEKLEKAREILRNRVIEVETHDGKKLRFKGADFSYGTGKNVGESEAGLKQHKSSREERGERARGELRGITETGPDEREKNNGTP